MDPIHVYHYMTDTYNDNKDGNRQSGGAVFVAKFYSVKMTQLLLRPQSVKTNKYMSLVYMKLMYTHRLDLFYAR